MWPILLGGAVEIDAICMKTYRQADISPWPGLGQSSNSGPGQRILSIRVFSRNEELGCMWAKVSVPFVSKLHQHASTERFGVYAKIRVLILHTGCRKFPGQHAICLQLTLIYWPRDCVCSRWKPQSWPRVMAQGGSLLKPKSLPDDLQMYTIQNYSN